MNNDTVNKLLELNRQFYQTFAGEFAATRQRIQPGVRQLMNELILTQPGEIKLLDLGCGNGELWRVLKHNDFRGNYLGLDFSPPLLEFSREEHTRAIFIQADLSQAKWADILPHDSFSLVTAFAVLHHIPGQMIRNQIVKNIHRLLIPGGYFLHSEWQFLNSSRLRARIQPWEAVEIASEQVEKNDYLLDWRAGGNGLRYVHHFDPAELAALASNNNFEICRTFFSDGQEGNLGLYQVWQSLA